MSSSREAAAIVDFPVKQAYGWRSGCAIAVMLIGNASQSMVFCIPAPLLPRISHAFNAQHHGVLIAQYVMAIAALGLMCGSAFSGVFIRRFGLRHVTAFSALVIAITGVVPAFATTTNLLLASRLALGAASGLLLISSTTLVAQGFDGKRRQRFIGYQVSFSGVTFLAVILMSGTVVQMVGWRLPFLFYAFFGLLVLVLTLVSVPKEVQALQNETVKPSAMLLQLWPIYGVIFLLGIVIVAPGIQLPFLMTARGITTPLIQSVIIGCANVCSAIAGLVFGRLLAAIGLRLAFVLGLAIAGVGMLVLSIAPDAVLAAGGTAMVGFGMGIFVPYLILLTVQYTERSAMGHTVGYSIAALFLGSFANPFVMGGFKTLFSAAGAFAAVGFLLLAGAAACVTIRRGMLIGVVKEAV